MNEEDVERLKRILGEVKNLDRVLDMVEFVMDAMKLADATVVLNLHNILTEVGRHLEKGNSLCAHEGMHLALAVCYERLALGMVEMMYSTMAKDEPQKLPDMTQLMYALKRCRMQKLDGSGLPFPFIENWYVGSLQAQRDAQKDVMNMVKDVLDEKKP